MKINPERIMLLLSALLLLMLILAIAFNTDEADSRKDTAPAVLKTAQKVLVSPLSEDSVEKHPFASAEFRRLSWARAPFLSGFSHLLRCRKDLGQFPEVLGGGGEEEFVVCAAWPT